MRYKLEFYLQYLYRHRVCGSFIWAAHHHIRIIVIVTDANIIIIKAPS